MTTIGAVRYDWTTHKPKCNGLGQILYRTELQDRSHVDAYNLTGTATWGHIEGVWSLVPGFGPDPGPDPGKDNFHFPDEENIRFSWLLMDWFGYPVTTFFALIYYNNGTWLMTCKIVDVYGGTVYDIWGTFYAGSSHYGDTYEVTPTVTDETPTAIGSFAIEHDEGTSYGIVSIGIAPAPDGAPV